MYQLVVHLHSQDNGIDIDRRDYARDKPEYLMLCEDAWNRMISVEECFEKEYGEAEESNKEDS